MRKPPTLYVIQHGMTAPSDPLYHMGVEVPGRWSRDKARALRFASREAAWDYVFLHVLETVRVGSL